MPIQVFPVTRLYVPPKANDAEKNVMIAPYDFMGHRMPERNLRYCPLPTQAVFAQAMRRFGGQELGVEAAAFVTETWGTCSFHVVSPSSPTSTPVAHIGDLVSVGDLLEHHFPALLQRGSGNSREEQEVRRNNETRSCVIAAALAYHKNPLNGEAPDIETLHEQPAVLRPDGKVILPKPTDLVATKDGDVVVQLGSCHVDEKMLNLAIKLHVRDSDGMVQTCTRCADVPKILSGLSVACP